MSRNWTPQQKNAIYATDGSVLVSVAAWVRAKLPCL